MSFTSLGEVSEDKPRLCWLYSEVLALRRAWRRRVRHRRICPDCTGEDSSTHLRWINAVRSCVFPSPMSVVESRDAPICTFCPISTTEYIWTPMTDMLANTSNFYIIFKGLIHSKMKISLCFTHSRVILGVYDFLQTNPIRVIYNIVLALLSVIIAVGGCFCSTVHKTSNKACAFIIKHALHGWGVRIKASWSEPMLFLNKNIHISNVLNTSLSLHLIVIRTGR